MDKLEKAALEEQFNDGTGQLGEVKTFKQAIIAAEKKLEKWFDEFYAAGEWFQTLTEEQKAEILRSGTDIQLAYRDRNSRGLMDLVTED